MFRKTRGYINKVVSKILPKNKDNKKENNIMNENILLWSQLYEDKAPWLEEEDLLSYNLASSIASEMARLTTIEMESKITGKVKETGKETNNKRAIYLDEQYQRVIDNIRIETEYACAKGGLVFKPYVENGKIYVEYVQADKFIPVKFNGSGDLIAAMFPDEVQKDGITYLRNEYHELFSDGTYYISNRSFMNGIECPLEYVEEWKDLEHEINLHDMDKPLFSYFKMPLANNKDCNSNLGVSVYSKAVDTIKAVDKQYTRIDWEFEGTELAIDVSMDLLKNGTELPKGKKRLYRKLDTDEDSFYKVFNPDIRDASLYNGLNKLLRSVEFKCGLAFGTFSDIQVVEKTAEEIKSSKQRSYSTVKDIQKSLKVSLEHLIYAMDYLTTFYKLAEKGEIQTSFHFDDSIIIDSKSEQMITLQEVSAGLIKPEYYLQKRYGVTEDQAMKMLPNMNPPQGEYDDLE